MIFNKFIVDETHPSPYAPDYFECTVWKDIGEGISWREHKHWMSGVLGAEGYISRYGDKSGCLLERRLIPTDPSSTMDMILVPLVAQQRHYRKGDYYISAVLSYPNGLSVIDSYFWEIYQIRGKAELCKDPVRFYDEREMETRIKHLLKQV